MKIELHRIAVRELVDGYVDDEEAGVRGYGGRLDIRPAYQRNFVYREKERNAVISTVMKGFPLNVMYWAKNPDGTFEVMDGQQRTISLCRYFNGDFAWGELDLSAKYFHRQPEDVQRKFLDYELMVYFCEGEPSEKIDWFKVINIAGLKLTAQEMRNAVNPCGVAVGREAYFRVDVAPEEFPDSEIVWVKSPGLDFVGPGTGRRVTVRGHAPGYESLEVHVGGRTDYAPTFQVRVVEPVTVDLRAWIIKKETMLPIRPDQVRQMIKDANDIFAQVGVTLNLVEPVVVTNIPDAYDAFYATPTNATSKWSYSQIVDIATNTCGLECYFIEGFVDRKKTLAVNGPRGAVITRGADFKDFAHEIGHEFGMCDIYVDSRKAENPDMPLIVLPSGEPVNYSHVQNDWNGGCDGRGQGGVRYYAANTKMVNILSRMLMKGTRGPSDNPVDITAGDIYGVYYTNDVSNAEIWSKGNAPVMFPFGYRNISHK